MEENQMDADNRVIVVGAGAAGCVIAARISENSDRQVLLIEAGPDYPNPALLPYDLARGRKNSMRAHDWGFFHRPNARQVLFPMPRGRVVGGSSAVNTCIAVRGQPWDFDEWADRGLKDWSWEMCLPAFIRLETDLDFADREHHGDSGPLPIRRYPVSEQAVWQQAFVEACREIGFPACADSNEPNTAGTGPHAMNKVNGRRISAAEAWLTPEVRKRPNLQILPNALTRRVIFEGRRAVGVEVEHLGEVVQCRGETVVLSAGAIGSPGILVRSGVGPRKQIEELGVELVADNPGVGSQLLDHPGTAIFLRPRFGSGTHRHDPLIQTCLRYGSRGFPHNNDMQIQPGSCVPVLELDLPIVSIMCHVGKPRGHGTIRWKSASPHSQPRIESRLLEEESDRRKAVEAMQLAREIAAAPSARKVVRHLWPPPFVLKRPSLTADWVFRACDSGYHPSGTVPMGTDNAPLAACDGRGRVRGTENLRVADASIMPTIPSGNIHLPTLMIGERFGEWLRDGELE